MDEILNENVDEEMLGKLLWITTLLNILGTVVTSREAIRAIVMSDYSAVEFAGNIRFVAEKVKAIEDLAQDTDILTKKIGYEALFLVNEALPYIVEIDRTLASVNVGYEIEGKLISEHLTAILAS